MKSLKRQGGWVEWIPAIASVASGLLGKEGQENTNDANAEINSAQMAFNADQAQKARDYNSAEAQVNREFQKEMSNTQYQRVVEDLNKAGLNPMMAYQRGGAGTPSGGQATATNATAGSMIPMGNSYGAGANAAITAAQIANTQAQTKVAEATARKVEAEVPNVEASTTKLRAEIPKITAEIDKLVEERANLIKEGWNKTDYGNLLRAQEELNRVEARLRGSQISQTEAQTQLNRVLTTLKGLEVPGMKNVANFEEFMSDDNLGNAGTGVKRLVEIIHSITGLRGLMK